jgi:hypothetical protein
MSDLREAALRVLAEAETDDNWDGEFTDYLVPAEAVDALRAALAIGPICGCDGEHCGDGPTCGYVR